MNKQLLIVLALFLGINCRAQITFEKGYFVKNTGEKTECLIKNLDWKNNPTQFEYKTSLDSDSKMASLRTIKEFGIIGIVKYQRHDVDIDVSKQDLNDLNTNRNPEFEKSTVFLKVLTEGKATLYVYENSILRKFFFKTENTPVEQLIYKKYKISPSKVSANTRYKQQLWGSLKCDKITLKRIENLPYYKNKLIDLFSDYNTCMNPETEVVVYKKNENKGILSLSVKPRLYISSLESEENITTKRVYDFGSKQNISLGVEAEYIFPFNKGKWGIFIEANYQYFKSNAELLVRNELSSSSDRIISQEINYKAIEVPVGIKHYMFINDFSSIFLTGSYAIDVDLDSTIERTETFTNGTLSREENLEIVGKGSIGLGIGYKYKNRYSVEFRYNTNRDLLSRFPAQKTDYNVSTIILGYRIF